MNSWIIIAIGCGLTAAALHATIVTGSPLSLVLFYLAPLPLFLAGLGWGPVVAGLAGLVGSATLAGVIDFRTGAFFLLSAGIAPVLLSRLALINRPAQAGIALEGEAVDSQTEWYPEGRLILWCAVIACALMTATMFVVGGNAEGFQVQVRAALDAMMTQMSSGMAPEDLANFEKAIDVFARLAAPLAAAIWLLATLLNLWIASWILKASNHSPRPWAPFAGYALPKSAGLILAGTMLASLLPGTLGLIALIGLMLMTTVFTVIGLATLHGLTIGNPMRSFILTSVYLALFVLSWVVMVPLIILALVDMQFNLRARKRTAAGPQDE